MEEYKSHIIKCVQCDSEFVLNAGEINYYNTKIITDEQGYSKRLALPKRCPACRKRRKEASGATQGGA